MDEKYSIRADNCGQIYLPLTDIYHFEPESQKNYDTHLNAEKPYSNNTSENIRQDLLSGLEL